MIRGLVGTNEINCYNGHFTDDELRKWSNKGLIKCPACGKDYEYCHGRIVSPYFRHKDKAECDRYSESETEEHIKGKKILYEWISKQNGVTDVILEGWLPETHQRPDIMFKYNGKQFVIEYQCTPIASEYYERHDLYQAAGITDIWVCGTEKYGTGNKTMDKECQFHLNPQETCKILIEFNSEIFSRSLPYNSTNFSKLKKKLYLSLDDILFSNGNLYANRNSIKSFIEMDLKTHDKQVKCNAVCKILFELKNKINDVMAKFSGIRDTNFKIDYYPSENDSKIGTYYLYNNGSFIAKFVVTGYMITTCYRDSYVFSKSYRGYSYYKGSELSYSDISGLKIGICKMVLKEIDEEIRRRCVINV